MTTEQVHFSSESNEWYTPAWIVGLARELMGGIDLDPASSDEAQQTIQATRHYTIERDGNGLALPWYGRVFLNPPYGDTVDAFVNALVERYERGDIESAVLVVASRTDTRWFQPLFRYPRCSIKGRVKFIAPAAHVERRIQEGKGKPSSPSFPSVIVYFGSEVERFRSLFSSYGHIDIPSSNAITLQRPQELVRGRDSALDLAIAAWLDSKAGRSGSKHTEKIYRSTVADFRAQLQPARLDLDSDPRAIALAAQGWAGLNNPAPATFNRRLAVLSSFYTFARKRGMLDLENPIGLVERRPVQSYAGIEALAPADVKKRLAAIDRSELEGMRDYCALAVALATGRRLAEVAGLRWAHLHFEGERIRLHFPRAKGGKVMADTLPAGVSRALTSYLAALYGAQIGGLRPDAPIWVALSRNTPSRPALSTRSLETICHDRLGIHFHGLRHTFARTMEDAGAKVSDIQGRLGHASLATTGRYLAALRSAENPHAEAVADLLGL